jgi:hypothetical protein
MTRSYRPEFLVSGSWGANGQRFATKEEAENSARSRFMRWTMPSDWRVTESDDDVNYRFDDAEGDVSL